MRTVWLGLLLVLVDVNLDLNGTRVGLLPDFAGYILLYRGFQALRGESARLGRLLPFSAGMALFTGLLYALDLLGLSSGMMGPAYWLGVLALFLSLCMSYWLVLGVQEIERYRQFDLGGAGLMRYWSAMALVMAASLPLQLLELLAAFAILAPFIAVVCFLAAFYQMARRYSGLG